MPFMRQLNVQSCHVCLNFIAINEVSRDPAVATILVPDGKFDVGGKEGGLDLEFHEVILNAVVASLRRVFARRNL
jgi:hypothetical protein